MHSPECRRASFPKSCSFTSKLYEGMTSDYWVYVPAEYDPATPAALMIWQDGHYHIDRDGPAQVPISGQPPSRLQNVIDNLTYQKKIPVAIYLLIDPGTIGTSGHAQHSVRHRFRPLSRFLRDEVLPEIYGKYNIRKDGYSHAIAGNSSGGICAFNAAWYMPELFSRVVARIPSFTAIQWKPGQQDGGNIYPFKVRKKTSATSASGCRTARRHGSRQEAGRCRIFEMANSLKFKGYDFHFSSEPARITMRRTTRRCPRCSRVALAGIRSGEDAAGV